MPSSKITVFKNSSPLSNAKVTLEFTGFANLGFTSPVFTDRTGVAIITHSSTGTANVYVNGSRKGQLSTPGQDVIHL